MLCGERSADILDSEGKNHGFIAHVVRIVQGLGEEPQQLERYDEHLRRGHFVVSLQVSETHSKEDIAQTLRQHGGEHILYLGPLIIEEL